MNSQLARQGSPKGWTISPAKRPVGGYNPSEILNCPVSIKNAMDDLLYTIVQDWFYSSGNAAYWQDVEGKMYTNYNETFRDLLVTWLRIIRKVSGIPT